MSEQYTNVQQLLDDVYSCLSQPAASEIGHNLLVKQKAKAKRILKKEEGHWMTDEQIDWFISHEYERLNNKKMSVKEITKKEVVQTTLDDHENALDYLVRIGTMIFVAKCVVMREEKEGQFMAPNHFMYSLSQVDQVFQINLT